MSSTNERKGSAPILEATGVERSFAVSRTEVRALRGVSFSIYAGETASITGASGAGKSTLLHILGGLDQPSGGHVLLRGKDLYAMSQVERTDIRATDFGFVFQSYYLLPELDVVENVVLPALTPAGAGRHSGGARKRGPGSAGPGGARGPGGPSAHRVIGWGATARGPGSGAD